MPRGAIRYHVGLLMRDRLWSREVCTMAEKAQKLLKRGEVHLVQRRLTDGVCEYWMFPTVSVKHDPAVL